MTPAAAKVVVEKYGALRQDDSSGHGKNSYRITVRQLESMIRLSEAIARANCMTDVRLALNFVISSPHVLMRWLSHVQITPAFVREAYSLLRQSIIHVEKDDIDIDDEEDEEVVAPAVNGHANGNGHASNGDMDDGENNIPIAPSSSAAGLASTPTRGPQQQPQGSAVSHQPTPGPSGLHAASPAPAPQPAKKQKVTISYDKYQMIKSLVVMRLSELERETGEGVSRPEIVTWYLEQREAEIQTVDELEAERVLVEKVVTKLVKEKLLLELVGQGLQSSDQDGAEQESQEAVPTLYVHPDYEN